MEDFKQFGLAIVITFIGCSIAVPLLLGIARMLGLYTIVQERRCKVFMLFGKVLGVIDEPGLHLLIFKLGPAALIVNWLGEVKDVDMRLDQEYLRSQPVNSEEGAPMGIGIWHEMFVSDPVSFLYKNTDPRGSLSANVSNSTVRCLSNMPLASMLVNRHTMSETVRNEVSPKSHEWGYKLGSVYRERRQGREPTAPGDLRHQARRRESSQRDYQQRRARGRHRVRESRGRAPPNRGRLTPIHRPRP
jgi:regulator of protease activity HflC (stomatin/prohibitin superfamily)